MGKNMTPITRKCNSVARTRVRKLGELKAGPDQLTAVFEEGFSEEVAVSRGGISFLSQRKWGPGRVEFPRSGHPGSQVGTP